MAEKLPPAAQLRTALLRLRDILGDSVSELAAGGSPVREMGA